MADGQVQCSIEEEGESCASAQRGGLEPSWEKQNSQSGTKGKLPQNEQEWMQTGVQLSWFGSTSFKQSWKWLLGALPIQPTHSLYFLFFSPLHDPSFPLCVLSPSFPSCLFMSVPFISAWFVPHFLFPFISLRSPFFHIRVASPPKKRCKACHSYPQHLLRVAVCRLLCSALLQCDIVVRKQAIAT